MSGVVLDHGDPISVIRFRSVCKDWAKGAKINNRNRLPSGTPALITSGLRPERVDVDNEDEHGGFGLHDIGCPERDVDNEDEHGGFGLHDVVNKSYYGDCDGLKNRAWVGGKDDWLVITDLRCNLELLNLITGSLIALPSFATIPGIYVVPVHSRHPGVCLNSLFELGLGGQSPSDDWLPDVMLRKVALCQIPRHEHGCKAVALLSAYPLQMVAVTAVPDLRLTPTIWIRLKNLEESILRRYTNVCIIHGKVMAVTDDVIDGPLVVIDRDIDDSVFYLAKCKRDLYLQVVCMYGEKDHPRFEEERLNRVVRPHYSFIPRCCIVFQQDIVTKRWETMQNLGDGCYSLFIGANYPYCLDVRNYLEEKDEDDYIDEKECLEGNCVYLSDTLDADVTLFEVKKGIYMYDFYYDPFQNLSYEKSKIIRQLPMWFRPTAAEVTS
ncbi:hypothetical protein BDA96_02G179000 [Sorghum bicolor]|uniref:KIB1-4 beta-propeller domain-containing protein n=1 Tax=Sorghum bicolor TaxID=4558 RepID=A0A921USR3_SORBI|nr:hypothetical protein BDA96_02G179000 [Sorghum bicolor]